jgi:hypothetical protein
MRVICVFLLLTSLATTHAADSRIIKAQTIDLKTFDDAYFGPITIRATATEKHSLESVTVEYKTIKVEFPGEALHDLRDIDIQTIHLDAILYDPAKPYLVFRLDSWDPAYRKVTGKPASVEFTIEDGTLVDRSISWDAASGQRYHDDKKFKPIK